MYELSFLFWYKIIFATELLVSIFLFCFKLPLKNKPLLRIGASLLIYYGVAFAIPIGSFSYNFYYVSFVFFLIFAVSIPLLKLIFDAPWISIVFCTMAAYTTQHFTYEAFNFFENVFGVSQQNGIFGYGKGEQLDTIFNPVVLSIYFCTYADINWLFYVLFGRKIKRNDELKLKQTSLLIVLMALLAVDVIFNAYLTFYSADNYNSTYMMFEELYNMICCIVILEVQFVFVKEKELEQQVSFYSNLLAEQKKHYEQDKANIERMNIKAHDLKHQIMALGSKGSISKDELEDISEAVSLYDKSYQTDNEALNIVLMEKQNICNKYDIKLSVIADGNCLSFIKESDIYSLFGNALDNAIEASIPLPKEKRYVSLVISSKNSFVHISVQNFYEGELTLKDGLPMTKKEDKNNHGFGVKSMEILVSKYHGDLSIQGKNGIFLLNIIIPIPVRLG